MRGDNQHQITSRCQSEGGTRLIKEELGRLVPRWECFGRKHIWTLADVAGASRCLHLSPAQCFKDISHRWALPESDAHLSPSHSFWFQWQHINPPKNEKEHFKDHVRGKKRSEHWRGMIFVIVQILQFLFFSFYVMNVSGGGIQEDITALFQAGKLHRVNLTWILIRKKHAVTLGLLVAFLSLYLDTLGLLLDSFL